VTYANGDKDVLYFKDFASGAMIESVVRRAKQLALKRYIRTGEKGITVDDLLSAVRDEFKENEDLPNTTNPDDWAKIAGTKGERIVSVKPLTGASKHERRDAERSSPRASTCNESSTKTWSHRCGTSSSQLSS
jgi:proteasome-associated ATPase